MDLPDWRYTLSETTLGAEEADAARDVVAGGWLSMGPRTAEFEEAFANKIGVAHAVAVANGTAALHIAYLALGIGPGDEVIQPSVTFVASANMTLAVGATPVFADIVSPHEPTIDPADVLRRITPRTKAVVAMHYGGYPARLSELREICRASRIALIEDACHGPGQRVPDLDNRALGSFGAFGTFSFFANKNMTTGEGGMVVTDDPDLAARTRLLRSHGMTTLSWDRHRGRASSYDVVHPGFNYRTNELSSALGLIQLTKLDAANARRRAVAEAYAGKFAGHESVKFVFGADASKGCGHIAAVLVPADTRDAVRDILKDAGIQTSLHYPPIHRFSAFSESGRSSGLSRSEEFADRTISLPIHPGMDGEDAAVIAESVVAAVSEASGAELGRDPIKRSA